MANYVRDSPGSPSYPPPIKPPHQNTLRCFRLSMSLTSLSSLADLSKFPIGFPRSTFRWGKMVECVLRIRCHFDSRLPGNIKFPPLGVSSVPFYFPLFLATFDVIADFAVAAGSSCKVLTTSATLTSQVLGL